VTVAMKEDGLVLVTEDDGSLPLGTISALGLYYHDTQFLSGYSLRINGQACAPLREHGGELRRGVPARESARDARRRDDPRVAVAVGAPHAVPR